MKTTKFFDKAFVTGCDETMEWMVPWFLKNFKKHSKAKIIFADFGVSKKFLEKYVPKNFSGVIDLSKDKGKGWFLKPQAMLNSRADKTVWIDTDCQVVGDIDSIFNELESQKLSMVKDHPWTTRRKELWHNSGVVGFIGAPMILKMWYQQVNSSPQVGDQEVLHSMLNPITKIQYIKDLPHKYNVLRLDIEDSNEPEDKRIIHWTGKKGKDHIRSLIENA